MAKTKSVGYRDWLNTGIRRMALVHCGLIGASAAQTIVMDAWHVIVPKTVLDRWLLTAGLLAVVGVVWYLAHTNSNSVAAYKRLTFLLITADIIFAAFNVYLQRGMAGKAVALFAIPIVVAAVLLSRSAVFATAMLATAAYLTATISYFVLHFNEGYKTELYAEVGFYCAGFFVIAALLSVIVRFGGNAADS